MKVCIVTPRHLSANPRVVKEAQALAAAGHRVHIVHGHYAAVGAAHDAALADPAWTLTPVAFGPQLASRLVYARQTALRHGALRAARWGVLRAAPGGAGAVRTPAAAAVAAVAVEPAALDLARATARIAADLYIAHYPAALPAVARAAARHGAPYAFDAEDFHPGDLPDDLRHALARRIVETLERRTLPGAAYLTAASPGIAAAYAARYGLALPAVVLNTLWKREAPAAPTPRGSGAPSLYWFSQTRGVDRGLECALAAVARAVARPRLVVRGAPQAGFDDAFLARARGLGCEDRVALLPPEAPALMVALAAGHDIGLAGETGTTLNHRLALANKIFTYLLAGVPALLSDVPAHVAFAATAPGATLTYRRDDPGDLARVLDDLLCDGARLAAARAAAWRLGQERFHYDADAATLVALAEGARRGATRRAA